MLQRVTVGTCSVVGFHTKTGYCPSVFGTTQYDLVRCSCIAAAVISIIANTCLAHQRSLAVASPAVLPHQRLLAAAKGTT